MEMNYKSCIPVTPEGVNYWLWSQLAKVALENHSLWKGHIKEEPLKNVVKEDSLMTSLRDEDKLIQEDKKALEIIHESLFVSILESYSYCETAKELWERLEAAYGKVSNLCRVFEVKTAISDLKQDQEELSKHQGRFRCLWSELKMLRPNTLDPEVLKDRLEQDVVFSLLLSLNPSYNH
ncbi:hypothetical protein Bca4012_063269 [Brassica carinata]